MRYLAFVLILASPLVWAGATADKFDYAQFEKRFNKADKDKKGKLSREEAYAEFPRMPEFFDEIDTNRDGFITLNEVQKAMERRVDAAINASQQAHRYGKVEVGKDAATGIGENANQELVFSSEAEERRYRRYQFYESIENDKLKASQSGEPVPASPSSTIVPTSPSSPILVKPF